MSKAMVKTMIDIVEVSVYQTEELVISVVVAKVSKCYATTIIYRIYDPYVRKIFRALNFA